MQRHLIPITLLGLLLGLLSVPAGAQGQGTPIPGEVLVKLRPGLSTTAIDALPGSIGGRLLKHFKQTGWAQMKLPAGLAQSEAMAKLRALTGVMAVEPNYRYYATATPNDPKYSQLWGMAKIQAPTAWNTTTGSQDVVVGVVDTGINYNHEDLKANMWRNPGEIPGNGVDDDGDGYVDDVYGINAITRTGNPMDDAGHGTHVAGTIGAMGNNGLGVAGVNWSVKLMALKFLGSDGSGSTADAVAAYDYAIAMKKRGVNIRVMNNSWGGSGSSQALKDAIDAAGNVGILSVVAAGNDGKNIDTSPSYPASYASPSILAVAASDQNDNMASFSNYSATRVGLAAPGVSILSTYYNGNSSYATMSGTSMATPHVAGAAALVAAANPALGMAQLKSVLLNNVDKLSQWTGKVSSGGRLNLARAIQAAGGTVTPPPTTTTTNQPDLLIRTNAAAAFVGDNVYSTGADQVASQQAAAGMASIYQIQLQNDGNAADTFTVTGPASVTGWTIRYFDAASGGTDITSQVTGTGWRTATVAAGAAIPMRVEITPDATVTAGTAKEVVISAKSVANTTKTDAVKAVATVPATTGKITDVTLTTSPVSPQPAGTSITVSASAVGGSAQYQFVVRRYIWGTWFTVTSRAYSTVPSFVWKPSSAGSYNITVYARAVGSTASYDVYRTLPYTIK